MSDNIELLPCPFCGGNNLRIEAFSVQPDNYHSGNVHCEDCEMDGPSGLSLPAGSWSSCKEDGEADGVAAWNRRAALARRPAPAVPDDLRAIHALVLNVLDRDAAAGNTVRGEIADELRAVIRSTINQQQDTVKMPRELLKELADIADSMQCYDARDDAMALLDMADATLADSPSAEQPDTVKAPRELLERIAPQLTWNGDEYQELRALLGKEGEV